MADGALVGCAAMASTSAQTKNTISLKGSSAIVAEFFGAPPFLRRSGFGLGTTRFPLQNKRRPTTLALTLLRHHTPHTGYAVNSILFQRGVYEPETFDRKKKYGLAMMVTNEDKLKVYLNNVMEQIQSACIFSQ